MCEKVQIIVDFPEPCFQKREFGFSYASKVLLLLLISLFTISPYSALPCENGYIRLAEIRFSNVQMDFLDK